MRVEARLTVIVVVAAGVLPAGCGQSTGEREPQAPEATAPVQRRPSARDRPPIPTKVTGAKGCTLEGPIDAALALTVDGTEDGVFMSRLYDAVGKVIIDPRGRSSAVVRVGPVQLDTGLSPSKSAFGGVRDVPALLGDILYPAPNAKFNVVGGDGERLELTVETAKLLEWVSPRPTFQLPCMSLTAGAETEERTFPKAEKRVYPITSRTALRATHQGPIVAYIRADDSVEVLETIRGRMRIQARLPRVGTVVAWTDEGHWKETKTPLEPIDGRGIGASFPDGTVACAAGTPILLLKDQRVYEVGSLQPWPMTFERLNRDGRVGVPVEKRDLVGSTVRFNSRFMSDSGLPLGDTGWLEVRREACADFVPDPPKGK